MDQKAFIAAITERMRPAPRLKGLFLGGSFGRGTADALSDVDLVAVAEPERWAEIGQAFRQAVEATVPVIYTNVLYGGALFNVISEQWLRCDFSIVTPQDFAKRAKDLVKPLLDPENLYAALPESLPPRTPDPNRVNGLILEFIRVIGLLPVALGRGELVTGVAGVGLLRDMLGNLLLEDVTLPDRGGILHMSKLLPPDQMRMLADLPYPRPDREQLVVAQLALAKAFMPRAKAMTARLGLPWPTAFEMATQRNLEKVTGRQWEW